MKDFNDFLLKYSQKDESLLQIAESVKWLTNEQCQDVARLVTQILREYHEWNQE